MATTSPAPSPLRAVVFDWAGTIVDFGSRAPAAAFTQIFAEEGVGVSEAQARGPMGLHERDHIVAMLGIEAVASAWLAAKGRPWTEADVDRLHAAYHPAQAALLADFADPVPGALETIRWCRERGIRIGSSTWYTRALMDLLIPRAAEQGLVVDVVVCAEEVRQGRPAPWMEIAAATALDAYPMDGVVKVDDTVPGILSGRNAGMWTVGVVQSGNELGLSEGELAALDPEERAELTERGRARLLAAGADFVLDSVEDLPACLEELGASLQRGAPRGYRDKPLFTPGPLTTSWTVKTAMLHDLGTRDHAFKDVVREVREGILAVAGVRRGAGWEAVPMQGCGTMGLEAVLSSLVPPGGRVLVLANGAYGRRIARMAQVLAGMEEVILSFPENESPDPGRVRATLRADPTIALVVMVHCETTTGILNPVEGVGEVVRAEGRTFFLDSMSAFGGVPLDLDATSVDVLVSSSNKCIEGVPGFSFVVARRSVLERARGWSRTLSLDLPAQLLGLEADGQFLYTPPTHALLAFRQALRELEAEGGVTARSERYRRNHEVLVRGMRAIGFTPYLPVELQSHIITTFLNPTDPHFRFDEFYDRVEDKGFVIYAGKVLHAKTFRIGTIGRLYEADVRGLLDAVRRTVDEMGVRLESP